MRRAAAFAILAFAILAPSASPETFRNPIRRPTNSTPDLLLHGDINGDGIDDIVYDDPTTSPITILTLFGTGGGAYIAGPVFNLPGNVNQNCRIGDFNGDGKLDLACASTTSIASMAFFAGTGNGTFAAPTYTALPGIPSGDHANLGFDLPGDLNRDGIPDLIAKSAGGPGVPILSNGTGGFKLAPLVQYYTETQNFFLDVNGDGKLDRLGSSFDISLGNGDGTFSQPVLYAHSANPTCAYGDVDGDGHPDAVCQSTLTADLSIYRGNSDGTFASTPEYQRSFTDPAKPWLSNGSFGFPFSILDLNGDGFPDILTNSVDGMTILYGKPGLTFADPVHFVTNYFPLAVFTIFPPISFLSDINGDGLLDVVAAGNNGIYTTFAQTTGGYKTAPSYEVNHIVSQVVAADFDGDSLPDIIASGDTALTFSHGNGDGTFANPTRIDTGVVHFNGYNTAMTSVIFHGDFNGDGKQDILAYGAPDAPSLNSQFYYLQSNGNGAFQPIQTVVLSDPNAALSATLNIRDINGDGRDDILQPPDIVNGTLPVFLSKSDGTFTSMSTTVPIESRLGTANWPATTPAVADFDHDGKLDVVFSANFNAYILHGHGDGTFDGVTSVPIPHFIDSTGIANSIAVATGDFNTDGKMDFAVLWGFTVGPTNANFRTQTIVFYGNNDGTFSPGVVVDDGNNGYAAMSTADVNQDGSDEIFLHGAGTIHGGANIAVLHGLPNRAFLPETPYLAGFGLASLDIVDLNRDGFPDLIFSNGDYNTRGNSVTVLLNQGNIPTVTGSLRAIPEPSVIGAPFTLSATLTPPDNSTLTGQVTFAIDGTNVGAATLTGNAATFHITNPPAIGTHALSATWTGNATYPTVTLTGTHVVTALPTTLTLTQPASSIKVGDPVTITDTLDTPTATGVNATGSIRITDSAQPATNTETFSSAPLPHTSHFGYTITASGTHTLTGVYSGDTNYASSTGTLTFAADAIPTTLTLLAAPNPATVGAPVTLTATLQAAQTCGPCGPLSGSIQFSDGVNIIGTAPIVSSGAASGTATLPVTFSTPGNHTLQANYAGDPARAPATATFTEQVIRANTTLTLRSSINPSTAGTPVTFTAHLTVSATGAPITSGSINFFDLFTGFGTAPLDANGDATLTISTLAAGTHTITASFALTDAFNVGTAILQQVVKPAPTITTLTANPNPVYQHRTLTLTAAVTATTNLTGAVTFLEGITPLGTSATLNGTATLSTTTLTPGTHTIIAAYLGDTNTLPSSSLTVTVTVLPSDFTLTATPTTLTVQTEHHLTFSLSAQSLGDFADTLTLSNALLPPHMSLRYTPTSVTLTPGSQAATSIYLDTDDVIGFKSSIAPQPSPTQLAWLLPAPLLLLLARKRRRTGLFLVTILALSLTACSGLYPASTPPGAYTLQLRATGATTGITHTLNVPITVTP